MRTFHERFAFAVVLMDAGAISAREVVKWAVDELERDEQLG